MKFAVRNKRKNLKAMREKEFLPLLENKLGIKELNEMQKKMLESASEKKDIILLSPTGSGKTLAFIMPVLKMLKPASGRVQCIVVAPSRELVIQIADVFNRLARDYKVTALYGGHKVEDEVNSLKQTPDIIVATPGRLLDHINRRNLDVLPVRILVLDEFDKILELGFEDELKKIVARLKNVSRNILTSATRTDIFPDFLRLENPIELNFLSNNAKVRSRLQIHRVDASGKDKLATLLALLKNITVGEHPERSIIFVNHRESAERVEEFLRKNGVDSILYHGALDQRERESAIVKFNNGSRPILVATDLAARGLDIEGVKNIIHYHQALTPEAYTHRNGRTARVNNDGDIYILVGPEEDVKEFTEFDNETHLDTSMERELKSGLVTVTVNGGKKEKISKGDILGFLTKECGIQGSDIGRISVFDHYTLFAIPSSDAKLVLEKGKSSKLKGHKYRFTV